MTGEVPNKDVSVSRNCRSFGCFFFVFKEIKIRKERLPQCIAKCKCR